MSGILGAIVGAGANMVGDWFQFERNKQENREIGDLNYQRQKWMQAQDYYNNLEMWRLQNEYNTPTAQMQRFMDAGLNPNLIYGQSNMASSVSPGTFSAPQTKEAEYQSTWMKQNMLMDSLLKFQQMKKIDLENENQDLQNKFLRDNYSNNLEYKELLTLLGKQKFTFTHEVNPYIKEYWFNKKDYYGWINDIRRQELLDWIVYNSVYNEGQTRENTGYQYQYDMLRNAYERNAYDQRYFKYDNWIDRIGNTLENTIGKLPFGFKMNKMSLTPYGAKRTQLGFGR